MDVSREDKAKMKEGAKSCWGKFARFADKFSEIIFSRSIFFLTLSNLLSSSQLSL